MKYKVIYPFLDLEDCKHFYNIGHIYPRGNMKPKKKRIEELSSKDNKIGAKLIEEVEAKKTGKD